MRPDSFLGRLQNLPERVPFFYGWVIVGCAVCAAFARQGSAVATLSVFISPMTTEFGWSRTALSGAVSAGGVLAALTAPTVGRWVDNHGPRVILSVSAVVIALAALALSQVTTLIGFYIAFAIARLTFASPFDIGISGSMANWFLRLRARAMSYITLSYTLGLAAMPMAAQATMNVFDWRMAWVTIAVLVLVIGALPNFLFMRRRPEDYGLVPDGAQASPAQSRADGARPEPRYTRAQALRTPSLWLLMGFSAFLFPCQAGISLHQAPHLIESGLSPTVAAAIVSTYSIVAAISGLGYARLVRVLAIRHCLSLAAMAIAVSAVAMLDVTTFAQAFVAAAAFGIGIGGLLTLLPVAWADYFGRLNFGAIRGITLPVQVCSQAIGPILAGVLYDATGSYKLSLMTFGVLAVIAAVFAFFARPP